MEHYIIIRVTEENIGNKTRAGFLRTILHRVAMENDIRISDNLIREDRELLQDGRPNPYKEAKELFSKVGRRT